MREYYITKNDSGQRLNKFLEKAVPRLSGGMMHKYLRLKRIKLNGKRTEAACRLAEGDKVQLYINDEYFEQVREEEAFRRIKTPRLTVVYEDENILLADKAPGMVVHADENGDSDTLIAHIQAYLYQSGAWNPDDAASFAPALCNRIDRNTGGIVIAAKTAEALRILNDKIKEHELKKKYVCVVLGRPEPPRGRIENFLRRDEKRKQVTLHDRPVPGPRPQRPSTARSPPRRSSRSSSASCSPDAPIRFAPTWPRSAVRCSATANTAAATATAPAARPVSCSIRLS